MPYPFAPLPLSPDDHTALRDVAARLVDDAQLKYQRFLWHDHQQLDGDAWGIVKQRADVRVYRDRRASSAADAGTRAPVHGLLSVAALQGSLHDAMYGVLDVHTDDVLRDSAVLATILEPTEARPFQSLRVRWAVQRVPFYARVFAKHRDAVLLDATGMRTLANGEAVGFHLQHSVTFAATPPLPAYRRCNLSICTMWRQTAPDRVQAFTVSFVEARDSKLTPITVTSVARTLTSVGDVVACAQKKKLAWLVDHSPTHVMEPERRLDSPPEKGCSVCTTSNWSTRRGIKSMCSVCAKATCSKCRVKRRLREGVGSSGELANQDVQICVTCLASTSCLDAAMVAQDEAHGDGDHCVDSTDELVRETLAKLLGLPTPAAKSSSTASFTSGSGASSHDPLEWEATMEARTTVALVAASVSARPQHLIGLWKLRWK